MYVPNIKAGRYAADSVVKKLIAMDSNSIRDGNHYMASEMVEEGASEIYPYFTEIYNRCYYLKA